MKYNSIFPRLPARKYFTIGDTGTQVIRLQRYLNWSNDGSKEPPLEVDGEYGELTADAVVLFETARGLKADGEFGKKCLRAAREMDKDKGWMALNFGVSICMDNGFAYGTGNRAHHAGCFFCGTNITGAKHATPGSRWERTYCCNPFVFACYAHGIRDAELLAACKRGACGGMSPRDWTKYKAIKLVGKAGSLKYNQLRPGDIIICAHHVYLMGANGRFAEASKEGWTPDTIAYKTGAKRRFNAYRKDKTAYVLRAA